MKKYQFPFIMIMRTSLLLTLLVIISTTCASAQIPGKAEKAIDDYFSEILKMYQIIELEEVDAALQKIDALKPSIEKKAKVLADLASEDAEILEFIDSESFMIELQDKPYFKELMRIMQNEDFGKKYRASRELQFKVEQMENIIEEYTDSETGLQAEISDFPAGVAFSITIKGNHKYSGTHEIITDFDEGAVAYIDDLGYLRIDIAGEAEGNEALVSFFIDNN